MATRSRKRRRRAPASPWQGTLRIGLAFGVLLSLNVYFLFFRHGTSVQSLLERARTPQLLVVAPAAHSTKPVRKAESDDLSTWADGTVGADVDSLEMLAQSLSFSVRDAHLVAVLFGKLPEAPLLPGDGWEVRYDAVGRPMAITLRRSKSLALVIERAGDSFAITRETRTLEVRRVELAGAVGPSLQETIVHAGERPALARALAELLSGELDVPADLLPTDRFAVVAEKHFLDGVFVRYGHLLGVEWAGHALASRSFWYRDGYYNEHGESAERLWRKSPLAADAGASTKERHRAPLLHLTAQGKWVEYFGAPNAEVVALRAGHVTLVGPQLVTITHDDNMQTQYRHLARHAPLRQGQLVRAGQPLGWLAPVQPTLQLTVLQNGASIDPLSTRAPRLPGLDNDRRMAFADAVGPRLAEMATLRTK